MNNNIENTVINPKGSACHTQIAQKFCKNLKSFTAQNYRSHKFFPLK